MDIMVKYKDLVIRIWYGLLLAYCAIILVLSQWDSLQSGLIVMPIFLFIPGYASIKLLNVSGGILQQGTVSIISTLAFVLFIRIILESLEISQFISDVTFLSIFSAAIFAYRMINPI